MKLTHLVPLLFLTLVTAVRADDFFEIHEIKYLEAKPPTDPPVFSQIQALDKNGRRILKDTFAPCIQVQVNVKDQIKGKSVFARAYFYDETRNLMVSATAPNIVIRAHNQKYDLPILLPKDTAQTIYFAVPDEAMSQSGWSTVVVVFGDAKGVDAQIYQRANGNGSFAAGISDYDYPEKNILEDKNGPPIDRKPVLDPIVQQVEETGDPKHPQITLFMHPPPGMTDASQAKGVLCMTVLANDADGVKRQLQGLDNASDYKGLFKFAEDHKLIVVCWGFGGAWNAQKSWDDLTPIDAQEQDQEFDHIAEAWERGIQAFVKDYGLPSSGYLLNGMSAAAQFSCRLALRKPDYFLAVHVHIPSSFDKPTPEASKILWLLTTGELDAGHDRSLRFYSQCRTLGYPMIYKAIVGLGHGDSTISNDLGLKFFEYALTMRDQRMAADSDPANHPLAPVNIGQAQDWLGSFDKPAYVGDVVNQEIFPIDQQDMVPPSFKTPLPTQALATAWNK